jgi:hypothetical protein
VAAWVSDARVSNHEGEGLLRGGDIIPVDETFEEKRVTKKVAAHDKEECGEKE